MSTVTNQKPARELDPLKLMSTAVGRKHNRNTSRQYSMRSIYINVSEGLDQPDLCYCQQKKVDRSTSPKVDKSTNQY